jgi:hypothetical protein
VRAEVAAAKVVKTQLFKGEAVALRKVTRHRGGEKWRVAAEIASRRVR